MTEPEKLAKLQQHTKEIYEIMLLAQSSFKIVDYMYRTRDDIAGEVINQNQYLKYSRHINWRLYVTELAKLFANRESDWFNVNRLITKFKKGGEFEKVTVIDETTVAAWERDLASEKAIIDNLLDQRDKLFGHTDKNRAHIKNELSIKDARTLIDIVKRIVSEIYVAVLDAPIDLDPFGEPVDDLKKLMEVQVFEKKKLINFWIAHCEEHKIDPASMGLPAKAFDL